MIDKELNVGQAELWLLERGQGGIPLIIHNNAHQSPEIKIFPAITVRRRGHATTNSYKLRNRPPKDGQRDENKNEKQTLGSWLC